MRTPLVEIPSGVRSSTSKRTTSLSDINERSTSNSSLTEIQSIIDLFSSSSANTRRYLLVQLISKCNPEEIHLVSSLIHDNNREVSMNHDQRMPHMHHQWYSSESNTSHYSTGSHSTTTFNSNLQSHFRHYPSNSNRASIPFLPEELMLHILSHLDPPTLKKASLLSKRFHHLLSDPHLWKRLCILYQYRPFYKDDDDDSESAPYDELSRKIQQQSSSIMLYEWKQIFKENWETRKNWISGHCWVRKVKRLNPEHNGRLCMAFDGTLVLSLEVGNEGNLWNMKTGQTSHQLGHAGHMISAAKIHHQKIISGSVDSTIRVWDTITGQCLMILRGHEGEINCVQHDDNFILSGSEDTTIRIWRMNDGMCTAILRGHEGAVCCLQFSGKIAVSGSTDQSIKIWNVMEGQLIRTLVGHTGHVYCLQFTNDIICSGSEDGCVRIWSLTSGECTKIIRGHDDAIVCLQFDERKVVTGSRDKTVRVWDIMTGRSLYVLRKHTEMIWNLHFNDHRLITSSFDQSLLVWEFAGKYWSKGGGDHVTATREGMVHDIAP